MSTRRRLVVVALLCLLLAMPLWTGGARAKEINSLTARLFMLDPTFQRTLLQLDGNTLQTIGGIPLGNASTSPFVMPRDIVPSPDGTRIAVVTYGRTPIYARDITIRVFDGTGLQLARFHPQVPISVGAISDDGRWIEGDRLWPQTSQSQIKPPTLSILDGKHGRVLSSLPLPGGADSGFVDIQAGRFYTVEETQPLVLTAYDLLAGKQLSHLSLDGVVAPWTGPKQISGLPVVHMPGVGMALSPDGKEIAIYNGETERLTLVDAPSMTVVSTRSVSRPQSWLERLGGALGLVPTAAEAKELPMGLSIGMRFSADGRSLYVTGTRYGVDKEGHTTATELGIERIDVTSRQLTAQALGGESFLWIGAAADSSALYVLTPREPSTQISSSPELLFTLRRLDPTSLQTTSERAFEGFNAPQLYILGRQAD